MNRLTALLAEWEAHPNDTTSQEAAAVRLRAALEGPGFSAATANPTLAPDPHDAYITGLREAAQIVDDCARQGLGLQSAASEVLRYADEAATGSA